MLRTILLLCCFASTLSLIAQDLFTVRAGLFRDVKREEFAELKPLGFIYGVPGENGTTEVFVGHFAEQSKAVAVATDLQQRGYRNAQAYALPVGQTPPATYIQVSLHSGTRPVEWAALERTGTLLVQSIDGLSKILTGPYPSAQAATEALPAIRALGYRDAFPKQVDPARLIRIGTFETGIKKPLIPITLRDNPPPSPATNPAPAVPGPSPVPAPATYGTPTEPAPAPPAANVPPTPPTVAALSPGPAIDGKTKRSSAAELQTVLKEQGFYDGAIDGYYGPGTTAAFDRAWRSLPELRKYNMLRPMLPSQYVGADWEETMVLLTIAYDLAAGRGNSAREATMQSERATLMAASQPLDAAAASRARNWAATVWANLDDWATEDPLHGQIFTAFRIAYHQTQVRLEDHYMDRGIAPLAARDLATAMLQNLIGAKLDRFL